MSTFGLVAVPLVCILLLDIARPNARLFLDLPVSIFDFDDNTLEGVYLEGINPPAVLLKN